MRKKSSISSFTASLISAAAKFHLNAVGWRYMFASGAIPSVAFLALLFLVPETPRYLMLKGREAQARTVLSRLVTPEEGEQEIAEIRETLAEHHSGKLFSFGATLIVIGIMISVFQQFVGINVVIYYAPEIFKGMGLSTDTSLLQTITWSGASTSPSPWWRSSRWTSSDASPCRSSARSGMADQHDYIGKTLTARLA